MALTYCHNIGGDATLLGKAVGASAFLLVWGLGMFVGPYSPLLFFSLTLASSMLAFSYVSVGAFVVVRNLGPLVRA